MSAILSPLGILNAVRGMRDGTREPDADTLDQVNVQLGRYMLFIAELRKRYPDVYGQIVEYCGHPRHPGSPQQSITDVGEAIT